MTRIPTVAEVREQEARIDAFLQTLPLPAHNRSTSAWHILTVADDQIRNVWHEIFQHVAGDADFTEALKFVLVHSNLLKYGLRYALQTVYEKQPAHRPIREPRLRGSSYTKAGSLLDSLSRYEGVVRAFTSYHNGRSTCVMDSGSHKLSFRQKDKAVQDNALDILLPMADEQPSPLVTLLIWLVAAQVRPSVVNEIASGVVGGASAKVHYTFKLPLGHRLLELLPDPPRIIPDGWLLPWASTSETRLLLKTLLVRCIYHVLAVDVGAHLLFDRGEPARGYGVGSLCLVISRRRWLTEISQMSGLSIEQVSQFVDTLTYGTNTRTPDPALQPLFQMDRNCLFVPALHVAASHLERNLLSLIARVDSKGFDHQSSLFEKQMFSEVQRVVGRRFSRFQMGVYIPGCKQAGEVDLLVADPSSHTILVGELRWMLPPGDAREVHNRKRDIDEKVSQLGRKVQAAKSHVTELLQLLGVDGTEIEHQDWRVCGLVLVSGYYGHCPESVEGLVVVPTSVFTIGVELCHSLRSMHAWLISNAWLPQQELHFSRGSSEIHLGSNIVEWDSVNINGTGSEYLEYVRNTATEMG